MLKNQLIAALQNLEQLSAEKNRIETEIAKQRRVVAVLESMIPPEERDASSLLLPALQSRAVGLTASVCDALRATGDWMSTTEIRESMKLSGFDFSSYKASPNSSISTILRRMAGRQVETQCTPDGTRQYRWRPASETILSDALTAADQNDRREFHNAVVLS